MRFFKILHSFFSSLGFNLLKIKNIIYLPKYTLDLLFFIFKGGTVNAIWPILGDHKNNSGSYDLQYFYQDLLVASYIFKANPTKHLDIGSRIDGFVAHVASYREIEVFDIRSNKFYLENNQFVNKFLEDKLQTAVNIAAEIRLKAHQSCLTIKIRNRITNFFKSSASNNLTFIHVEN